VNRSIVALAGFVAVLAASANAAVERVTGTFALPNSAPRAAATLEFQRIGPLDAKLDLSETAGGRTIRDYDLDMTQRLHLIVISDDLEWFAHVHPTLDASGHFTIEIHVPKQGRYYVYADADPAGLGKQVFRFPLRFGNAMPRTPVLAAGVKSAGAGPYAVSLDSLALHTNGPTTLRVAISEGGKPAADLRPYLGSAAHAVFVNAATLAYVHVHPISSGADSMAAMDGMGGMAGMEMPALSDDAKVPAHLTLQLSPVPPGRYKLWLQFRGHSGLHVA
jgi:hypothetical protein